MKHWKDVVSLVSAYNKRAFQNKIIEKHIEINDVIYWVSRMV